MCITPPEFIFPTPTRASSSTGDFSRMPMALANGLVQYHTAICSLGTELSGDDCNSRGPETVGLLPARAAHTATPVGRLGLPWTCDPQAMLPSGAHTGQSRARCVYIPEPLSPTLPITGAHTPLPIPRPSGAPMRLRPLWTICWGRNET